MSLFNVRETETEAVVAEADSLPAARKALADLVEPGEVMAATRAKPGDDVGGYWIEQF